MNAPAAIPDFLRLRRQAAGIVATAQASVAEARTAITLSLVLSIAAAALATGAVVYVAVDDRRRAR